MKNSKIIKVIYMSAIAVLATSFLLVILEKSQVINIYSKPLPETSNEVRGVNEVDYSPADPTENDEINAKKESGQLGTDNQAQPEPGTPINVVLTAATQDTAGGPVVVRVLLTDVSSGTCNIAISKDGVTNNYTRNVVNAGTYYNCEALDIPASELSAGTWQLNVSVTNGDRTGAANQSVEVTL
jgi:hypothetical protein